MNRSIQLPVPEYVPARNGSCPCGSGRTFKRCCSDQLSVERRARRAGQLLQEEKYKEALQVARADFTAYYILYKSHTEIAVRAGMPLKGSLYEIDMNAFCEIIDTIFLCYTKCEITKEFPVTLERFRASVVGDPWQRRIQYFHTMYALWPSWDEEAGRREFRKLGFPEGEDSVEMIQLYLDLFDEELSFSQKQNLIDCILARTKKLSDRLHYTGARACLYMLIGDENRACDELTAIIDEVKAKPGEDDLDTYERYCLAAIVELLGMVRHDDEVLKDAQSRYEALLEDDYFSDRGRANLLTLIADTRRTRRDWQGAKIAYESALKLDQSPVCSIFLAECLLRLDNAKEGRTVLDAVDDKTLDHAGRLDRALVSSAFAIESGASVELQKSKSDLNALNVKVPYFRDRRNTALLNIQEAITNGTSRPLLERAKRLLAGLKGGWMNYVILKPTVMGMGIDIGKMIDDAAKRGQTSKVQHHEATTSSAVELKRGLDSKAKN